MWARTAFTIGGGRSTTRCTRENYFPVTEKMSVLKSATVVCLCAALSARLYNKVITVNLATPSLPLSLTASLYTFAGQRMKSIIRRVLHTHESYMGRAREYVDIHYRCSLDTKMYIVNACTSDVKTRLCWGSHSLRLA